MFWLIDLLFAIWYDFWSFMPVQKNSGTHIKNHFLTCQKVIFDVVQSHQVI